MHSILRNNGWGDRLPHPDLAFFLEFCHESVSKDFEEEVAKPEVARALQAVTMHNKYQHAQTTTDGKPITKDNYRLVLAHILDNVQSICVYLHDSNKALADQHGGILKYGGIKNLMSKLGTGVNVGEPHSFFEQLGLLHAAQHVSTTRNAAVELGAMQGLLENLLKAIDEA